MKLSVLQWNIWYKEKIENIAQFLLGHSADVICLQELTINNPQQSVADTVRYIADQLGYEYVYEELILDDQELNLANAIFSRYPIKETKKCWINTPTGMDRYDDQYRAYVEATVDVNGTTVVVGTVHMSYTDAFGVTPRKLTEAKNLIEQIKNKARGYILTGDFNVTPDSEIIRLLSDKLVNAGPDFAQKTWTTKPFSYDGFEATTLDWRLDYIFTSPDVRVVSAEILKTDFSDHLPIVAIVELS